MANTLTYNELKKVVWCKDNNSVSELRKLDFDPNSVPKDDWTLSNSYLLQACSKGDFDVVRILLELGANATVKDDVGHTVLIVVCDTFDKRRGELLEYLLERADIRAHIDDALPTTMIFDHPSSWSGWTALHFAADTGNMAIARVLLHFGADTTKINGQGRTAAELARYNIHTELAELIESSAIVEWRPWKHNRLPLSFRDAMRTLALLAKSRT